MEWSWLKESEYITSSAWEESLQCSGDGEWEQAERWMKGKRDELNMPGEAFGGVEMELLWWGEASVEAQNAAEEVMRRNLEGPREMEIKCNFWCMHWKNVIDLLFLVFSYSLNFVAGRDVGL